MKLRLAKVAAWLLVTALITITHDTAVARLELGSSTHGVLSDGSSDADLSGHPEKNALAGFVRIATNKKAVQAGAVESPNPVPPSSTVLVVAPHPDDETLAAGGLIQRVLGTRGTVRIVYVSNGDGYLEAVQAQMQGRPPSADDFQRYGRQRQAEAVEAQLELGVPPTWLTFLGFPDGGIRALWSEYWCSADPYVSPFTHQSRSDQNAHLLYRGVELERELTRLLSTWKPDIVVAPDPRDVHSDHCAVGLFVLQALRELRRRGTPALPKVWGYLVHFPGYPGDPGWKDATRHSGACGDKDGAATLSDTKWLQLELEEKQVRSKRSALTRYATQVQVMRPFLEQFARSEEWFSILEPKHWDLPRVIRKGRKTTKPAEGCSANQGMIGNFVCQRCDGRPNGQRLPLYSSRRLQAKPCRVRWRSPTHRLGKGVLCSWSIQRLTKSISRATAPV
ncbi:1D-myo-inositol 2-acetamido-2-deoxy-alpha-D-glucopyranoside deacetylase [bacterium HR30]|nr:1D-myo-inositol 2-acetamido-2-deoxy-alpha-D-glucopyranoside deacetylase [bacterium HR30]